MSWNIKDFILEVISEEQLNEKLLVYNNRKPYGQVVFLAGGAGSGKGFASDHFIDKEMFKVRDVDEMKKQLQILNRLGKIDIDGILKKYGKNIPAAEIENIRNLQSQGFQLRNLQLKKPDHVRALHQLVKGKDNPETLPNIMFDITAKDVSDITSVIPMLKKVGYKSKNVHLTWILTKFLTAIENNKQRERMVPEDILLKTHEGAANTVWSLVTKAMPKGLNGRVDVILNNPEHTVKYKYADGNEVDGIAKGFLSLPLKKEGGKINPEKVWKQKLYGWVKNNAPDSITKYM
jgi:dephospho-CoA kinase